MSALSLSLSEILFKMYCLLMLRSLISATNSACSSSMPKPVMRLGITSASSSVSLMILIALSISRRITARPSKRCSLFFIFARLKLSSLHTQVLLHLSHSSRIWAIPITLGEPSMRMLKLHEKVSSSFVNLKSFVMSCSWSVPLLQSIVILRPSRSVSSRISAISLAFLLLTRSAMLSMIASTLVE